MTSLKIGQGKKDAGKKVYLKGRLLKAEAIRVPIEYQTFSHYSEEEPAEEREMSIFVIVGKNCIMRSCVAVSREENEEDEDCIETEREREGENFGPVQ